jgi:hypothetical protein
VLAAIHSFDHSALDYVVHFGIDVLGTLATLYAQRYVKSQVAQFATWLVLSLLVTVTTVNVVG